MASETNTMHRSTQFVKNRLSLNYDTSAAHHIAERVSWKKKRNNLNSPYHICVAGKFGREFNLVIW